MLAQRHARSFPTASDARAYVAEQIAAQRAKGYLEVTAAVAAPVEDELARREQRFEWSEGGDGKELCVIVQLDRKVTVRSGARVRGVDLFDPAQEHTDEYPTTANATAAYNELVAKLNYDHPVVEIEREDRAAVSSYVPQTHPALEAECRAAPDNPGPWSVYADWLQSQGDVLGEIASLAAAGKPQLAKPKIRAHMFPLVGHDDYIPALEYRHGFVTGARFKRTYQDEGTPLGDLVRGFLGGALARFVESLRFGLTGWESNNDWSPTMRAITESVRAPDIRSLRFDDFTRDDQEISWTAFGDFSFAWPHLPSLELLHIKAGGGGTLGTLDLPALRTFIRESGGLGQDELDSITNASWPRLEHLELWFGSRDYGAAGTVSSVEAILAGKLPRLVHLGVVNCEFSDDLIPALATSPRLRQLHSLDLTKGVMHARATEALVRHARAFRHLASIDLSENLLEPEHAIAIRDVLDNVIIGEQRDYDYEDGDDEEDFPRYVAVGE